MEGALPGSRRRNPSLSVATGEDGRCLLHCFAGCTIEAVTQALGLGVGDLFDRSKQGPGGAGSAATQLVDVVHASGAELFHDQARIPHARFEVAGHHEVWPIESEDFALWLGRIFFEREGRAVSSIGLTDAVRTLAAEARFKGKQRSVYRRVAGDLAAMYVDLGDAAWRVVEVTPGGWRILNNSPVAFVRDSAARALPEPERGGSLNELRALLNLAGEEDWLLVRGSIIAMLHPLGPYPVVLLRGESGSAKTTAALMLSRLVDPFAGQFSVGTPQPRDVMASAMNSWLVGFDNVSLIKQNLSDVLCGLTSGAGVRERRYYTNGGLFVGEARRPVLLTALVQIASRSDLIDRLIAPELVHIDEEDRLDDQEVIAQFEELAPRIFAGVLDALAAGLRHLPDTRPTRLPRLASIARLVTAAERGMEWEEGAFIHAMARSRGEAMRASLEARPILHALVRFMKMMPHIALGRWEGAPTYLYELLGNVTEDDVVRGGAWPRSPESMSKSFKEQAPALREAGLKATVGERRGGGNRDRFITVEWIRDAGDARDAS